MIAGCRRDHLVPLGNMRYVAQRIPGAIMLELEGNHISAIIALHKMIRAIIAGLEQKN